MMFTDLIDLWMRCYFFPGLQPRRGTDVHVLLDVLFVWVEEY